MEAAFSDIRAGMAPVLRYLPPTILMIKTNGDEEGGAAYTRSNAVILPQGMISPEAVEMRNLVAHELFHIASSLQVQSRAEGSALRGHRLRQVQRDRFPAELEPHRITNPDAPWNEHYIRLRAGVKEVWAVPVIFASVERYDVNRGGGVL